MELFIIKNYILNTTKSLLENKSALVGFDGFVDALFKIKKEAGENNSSYFDKIKSIGEYIVKKNTSFCLDVEDIKTKIGGNAPILANALGSLGVQTDLIGALGFPEINPYFKKIAENCTLKSIAEPGMAYIYEFEDGKIMLSNSSSISTINWSKLKELVSLEFLIQSFESNDMFCLLNWSEILGMTSIMEGILLDVFPKINLKNKITFFDLSDFSNRNQIDIIKAIELINKFGEQTKTVLSLNKNELNTLYSFFFKEEDFTSGKKGKALFDHLNIEILVLHNSKETFVFTKDNEYHALPILIDKPLMSTGAGDHFNAGFCCGLLANLELKECLFLANSVASFYIKTGVSPNINDIID